MKQKHTVESQLHCKATAELNMSIINDLLQVDGKIEDLLHETSEHKDESDNSDRSSNEESRQSRS
jgi:hypothetical protein